MSNDPQLALPFDPATAAEGGRIIATRPLLQHRGFNTVMKKLHYVRRYFPELSSQTIKVGLTRTASGMAIAGGNEVWLNPNRISYHTIAHEFVHLLQGRHSVPGGERSCDVFALARHWTLNDTAPYYVKVPPGLLDLWGKLPPDSAKLVYDVASRAIEMRKSGTRNYIAYFEKALRETTRSRRRATLFTGAE